MAKGKHKNLINRNQDHSPSLEPSTPTSASPGFPQHTQKNKIQIQNHISWCWLVEDLKKGINNSLKEIQESTDKQVEVLKESQENTAKQVKSVLVRVL